METLEEVFDKWKSRWSSTLLESFIFHAISLQERYGGELVKLSQTHLGSDIKVPTVYAILKRASNDNLLKQEEKRTEGVTRGTKRKYYTLTYLGKKYLGLMKERISIDIELLKDDPKRLTIKEEKE